VSCRPIYIAFLISLLTAVGLGVARADAPIGAISEPNTRDAIAIPAKGGSARDLHFQAAVYENDTVITRDLGTALQFTDQSLLTVSSNSKVVLDSFVFDKGAGSLAGKVKLGVGVFRLVTGALVKHDDLQLLTPVTTLTIRGTDLVVSVEADGTTRLRLYEGSIRIKTCNGTSIWMHAGERVVVSPACTAIVLNTDTGTVIATAGANGGPSGAVNGSNGTPNGGGDPGTGGGNPGTGGGDPDTGGGDPGAGGGDPSTGGKDPGAGNGGPGLGNGGQDNGKGNGGDPGDGRGNNPAH
jgi:hypothetical protein